MDDTFIDIRRSIGRGRIVGGLKITLCRRERTGAGLGLGPTQLDGGVESARV